MKTIYLNLDEEITSVIDRLTEAKGNKAVLVVPEGASIFQSLINLKLLKREADNLGKDIILVTTDELGRQLAPKANLIVKHPNSFESETEENQEEEDIIDILTEELDSSFRKQESDLYPEVSLASVKQMADIVGPSPKTKITQRFLGKGNRFRPNEIFKKFNYSAPPIESASSAVSAASRVKSRPIFFFIFISLALAASAFAAYLILPSAEIIIFPKTETVSFNLSVSGSNAISQIDSSLNKIPIQAVKIEKSLSREFRSTGEKEFNEKAKGVITVFNGYSSAPQILVKTTRFLSKEGKLFRIGQTITVPGAKVEEGKIIPQSIDVEVVADEPGKEYNINPTEFTIPGFKGTAKYDAFYGRSSAAMSGGAIGKIKIVSAEDIEKAKNLLTEELKNFVNQAVKEQMPQNLKLVEDGLEEGDLEISGPAAESQADNFVIEIKTSKRLLLFNEKDIRDLVDLNLVSEINQDRIPLSETQKITWEKPIINWDKTEVSFNLQIQEDAAWQVDLRNLRENLAGKDETAVRKYLSNRPEIESAKVTFWPFWVKRMPLDEGKIKIKVE